VISNPSSLLLGLSFTSSSGVSSDHIGITAVTLEASDDDDLWLSKVKQTLVLGGHYDNESKSITARMVNEGTHLILFCDFVVERQRIVPAQRHRNLGLIGRRRRFRSLTGYTKSAERLKVIVDLSFSFAIFFDDRWTTVERGLSRVGQDSDAE
jgi:hypothetical protein